MKINCVLRNENFPSFASYICLEIKYKNENKNKNEQWLLLIIANKMKQVICISLL